MLAQEETIGPLVAKTIYDDTPAGTGVNLLSAPITSNFAQNLKLALTGANTITVTGTDADGNEIQSIFTSSITGTQHYREVTEVINTTTNPIDLHFDTGTAVTRTIPVNWRQTPFNMACAAIVDGSAAGSASMESTPFGPSEASFPSTGVWFPIIGVDLTDFSASATTKSAQTNLNWPQKAVRGKLTSETGSAWTFIFIQGDNP